VGLQDLISNKDPQIRTSSPIALKVVQEYCPVRWGNAPEQNPISGGAIHHPVHGAINQAAGCSGISWDTVEHDRNPGDVYLLPSGLPPCVTIQPKHAAKARIDIRIRPLLLNNPDNVRPVGDGVSELRIHYGPAIGFSSSSKQRQYSPFLLEGVTTLSRRILDRPKTLLAIFKGSQ